MQDLKNEIEELWSRRDELSGNPDARETVNAAIGGVQAHTDPAAQVAAASANAAKSTCAVPR